jgi:hypothetical protein
MKKPGRKPKPVQKDKPVFLYTSKCCNAPATKAPCVFLGYRTKEAGTQGLGTFRCTVCHKPCSCNRTKNSLDKVPETC